MKNFGKWFSCILFSLLFTSFTGFAYANEADDLNNMGSKFTASKNYTKAASYFLKAAKMGSAEAQCNIANCYRTGQGVKIDPVKAVYWFDKAAKQGIADAQFWLGMCYYQGTGVEKTPVIAYTLWEKAALQDHTEAQFFYGMSLYFASIIQKQPEMKEFAHEMLDRAAKKGHQGAKNMLKQFQW